MSFEYFVSCSRELPSGHFGYPPKIFYQSYAEYFYSKDYRIDKYQYDRLGHDEYFHAEEQNCLLPGKVAIYKNSGGDGGFSLFPIDPHENLSDYGPEFAKHFRYAYNYMITRGDMAEYLRTYLLPEDKIDLLYLGLGANSPEETESTFELLPSTDSNDLFEYLTGIKKQIRIQVKDSGKNAAMPMEVSVRTQHVVHITPLKAPLTRNEIVPISYFESLHSSELACVICHHEKPYGPHCSWKIKPCYPE